MKKIKKISLVVLILGITLFFVLLFGLTSVKVNVSLDDKETNEEQIKNEDIISFLKKNKIINSSDTYVGYNREIGLFGFEGDWKYIYKRNNETYYYVEISPHSEKNEGEFAGYQFKPNETFYVIIIRDCEYNKDAESVDETILDEFGEITCYVVSGTNNNLEIKQIDPTGYIFY